MGDLGMELDGVDLAAFVAHRRNGTLVGRRDDGKALGRRGDIVAVAHPADGGLRYVIKKDIVLDGQLDLAVLAAVLGACDRTARHVGDQLTAVADTEDRNTGVEDRGIVLPRRSGDEPGGRGVRILVRLHAGQPIEQILRDHEEVRRLLQPSGAQIGAELIDRIEGLKLCAGALRFCDAHLDLFGQGIDVPEKASVLSEHAVRKAVDLLGFQRSVFHPSRNVPSGGRPDVDG